MNNDTEITVFDPNEFIDSMIEEMGMEDAEPEKRMMLKEYLERQLDHAVATAASQFLNPEAIDRVVEEYRNMGNAAYLFQKCIQQSPEAQWAILSALEEFKEQTLNAYFSIKQ